MSPSGVLCLGNKRGGDGTRRGYSRVIATSGMALLSMTGFAGILAVAYIYVLKKGVLNWKA